MAYNETKISCKQESYRKKLKLPDACRNQVLQQETGHGLHLQVSLYVQQYMETYCCYRASQGII